MSNSIQIKLTDFHKFSTGQTCLIGNPVSGSHKIITSDCKAIIKVNDNKEYPLNIVGQDINVRSNITSQNQQTFLRISDDLGELLSDFEQKEFVVIVDYPD